MEMDIAEGGHVLAVGAMEDILSLQRRLAPHTGKGAFLPLDRLLYMVREYPLLLGAAHPFRPDSHIPAQPEALLKQFDFIDLNGKDVAENGKAARCQVDCLAALLRVPAVAGSDTHQSFQYGCIYNEFKADCDTVRALGEQIRQGAYAIHVSGTAAFQVRTAKVLKRSLKQIHALGGDYVSVLIRES